MYFELKRKNRFLRSITRGTRVGRAHVHVDSGPLGTGALIKLEEIVSNFKSLKINKIQKQLEESGARCGTEEFSDVGQNSYGTLLFPVRDPIHVPGILTIFQFSERSQSTYFGPQTSHY